MEERLQVGKATRSTPRIHPSLRALVRSNQQPDSFLTIIIHLGFVIRAASSSGGRMEGAGCSVPRVCWAEPE